MRHIPCACTGCGGQLSKPWLPNLEKHNNHVMLSNQKHVSTLQSYGAIVNGVFAKLNLKKETTNTNGMKLKISLSCKARLRRQQTKLNTIIWVHFKLATVTHMDIILLDGQVMHITYRKI